MENKHTAHTYHPMPVVFERAEGVYAWDPEGKKYFDFLSAYSAVNQGHCHPKILKALHDQSKKLTLSSRAFHNSVFPVFSKYITELFKYDMVIPMNTGAEAVETAIKSARRWGYLSKKIPENEAIIVVCSENFHGRTIGIISMSSDEDSYNHFGPLLSGYITIPYGDSQALEDVLKVHGEKVCGFLFEPIQGEAGVIVPPDGYYTRVSDLCKKHNVLMIVDEVQTGLCRTGRMLASDWEPCQPDLVILGKALGGGIFPVSCVLGDEKVMGLYKPGTHGSTFGGNPLASAVALASLEVLQEEKLAEKADFLGQKLRTELKKLQKKFPFITTVRGRGLLNAIVVDSKYKRTAWDLCLLLAERGLLAKPTHDHIIRFAPPLVITEQQLDECIQIVAQSLEEFAK